MQFISCPLCREETSQPNDGEESLQSNHIINSLFDIREQVILEQVTTCSEHKQPLNAFCEVCGEVVCRDCFMSMKHNKHQSRITLINECYSRHHEELVRKLHLVKEKIIGMSTAVEGLVAMEEKVVKQEEDMGKEIEQHAQQIIDMIQASKDTLLDQMRTAAREKKELLAKQREEAERVLSQLKECEALVEINLKDLSRLEILKEKWQMLDQMKETTQFVDPTVFQPVGKADMVFVRNATFLYNYQEIGEFHCRTFGKGVLEETPGGKIKKKISLNFTILSRDELPFSLPSSLISCKLTSTDLGKHMRCDVKQTAEGKYSITFTPFSRNHNLTVQVGGIEAPGSPFVIPITPTPQMRIEPVKTITGLSSPWGVAVCNNGDIVVAENEAHCITILNKQGKKVKSFGTKGTKIDFCYPRGVAVTKEGHILVIDETRLHKLSLDGDYIQSISRKIEKASQQFFSITEGIAVHPTTLQIFIADCGNDRIQVFNNDLSYSYTIESYYSNHSSAKGHFREPRGVGFDRDNNLYVSEYGNHCITKLTTKGQYLARFGSEGSDPGQLFGPASLTTDGEYIYVTELGIDRVSIFDTKGSFVHCFWNRGKEDDSISHGIAIDQSGNLYVSDSYTNILVY